MNEKYLWDKIGEDAEIERLENSLKAFRYRETAAPELPAKIIPFEAKPSRRFLRPALAFVFGAVLFSAGLSVRSSFFKTNSTVETAAVENNIPTLPDNSAPVSEAAKAIKPNAPTVIKETVPTLKKSSFDRKTIKASKTVHATNSSGETIARNDSANRKSVKLTGEEKYAYDQLMLALSITSSKLQIVRNKSEGANLENRPAGDGK